MDTVLSLVNECTHINSLQLREGIYTLIHIITNYGTNALNAQTNIDQKQGEMYSSDVSLLGVSR